MSVAGPGGLNGLIENLKQLQNSPLIAHVKEDMKNLLLELEYLKGVMGDLSRSDDESSYLKITSREIRGIVDEAEEAVDTYIVLAALPKSKVLSRISHYHPKELKEAGRRIAYVTDQINQINERNMRARFDGLQSLAVPGSRINRPGRSSQVPRVEEHHVPGLQNQAKDVSKLVIEGNGNLEVITIAGMPGLGKTTLAEMVYKDANIVHHFVIRAFIYVSQEYDKKDVLLQILNSFPTVNDQEEPEVRDMKEKELEKFVYQKLVGKRYLIVLDDVWDSKDWDAFSGAFPNNEKLGCRVLITTRNARVAEHANPNNPHFLYMLDLLTIDESRELLRWKVFGDEDFESPCLLDLYSTVFKF